MPTIGPEIQEAITPDPPLEAEVGAMQAIVDSFQPLNTDARERVLAWARARFERGVRKTGIELLIATIDAVADWRDSLVEPTEADQKLIEHVLKGTRHDPAGAKLAPKPGAKAVRG